MNNTSTKKVNIHTNLTNYYLTKQEEADFMNNIDIKALENSIQISEEDIVNGKVLEFKEAMAKIHKEVFNE